MNLASETAAAPASSACALSPAEIRSIAERLRDAARQFTGARDAARSLATLFERWRERRFPERHATVARLSASTGMSRELLDESLDALLAPFSPEALESFAQSAVPRARVGAFIMPGNVPGAGMHELVAALLSGAGAIVKTSRREPLFFPAFARSLAKADPATASRLRVITFGRERTDLTAALTAHCDFVVALGEDETVARLRGGARLFGFGSRASGALVSLTGPVNVPALGDAIARDVALFEQQGCLSPQHVFVAAPDGREPLALADAVADALDKLASKLPPARLSLHCAAAIRRIRESARWRGIGGRDVELWEGRDMAWTVVFDALARFTVGPGFRTVVITPIRGRAELESRLKPIAGRLEAFAIAAAPPERASWMEVLAGAGASWLCDPGRMQSPPLAWPHGGGAFVNFISGAR